MRGIIGIPILFLLLFIVGAIVGNVFPALYAFPLAVSVVLPLAYFGLLYIAYGFKQTVVELIYALWPIMPIKAKIWALGNDGEL